MVASPSPAGSPDRRLDAQVQFGAGWPEGLVERGQCLEESRAAERGVWGGQLAQHEVHVGREGCRPWRQRHWRGRDRSPLLANLRALRGAASPRTGKRRSSAAAKRTAGRTAGPSAAAGIGAAAALGGLTGPSIEESVGRFWVAPVPLPPRPATLATDVDLVLRQLPPPDAAIGGAELLETLSALYQAFRPPGAELELGIDNPISRYRR